MTSRTGFLLMYWHKTTGHQNIDIFFTSYTSTRIERTRILQNSISFNLQNKIKSILGYPLAVFSCIASNIVEQAQCEMFISYAIHFGTRIFSASLTVDHVQILFETKWSNLKCVNCAWNKCRSIDRTTNTHNNNSVSVCFVRLVVLRFYIVIMVQFISN